MYARWVFKIIFVMAFLLSGLITMLHIIPYRMGLMSLLVIPLLLIYRVRFGPAILAFITLGFVVVMSAINSGVSVTQLFYFSRTLLFSFLIYSLTRLYLKPHNISRVVKACIWIAAIQLPVVVLQQISFSLIPASFTAGLVREADFDFGTFNLGDAAMTFFLTLVIIFLLFDKRSSLFVKASLKYPLLIWLTLTILVVNSNLGRLIVVCVWAVSLLRSPKPKLIFTIVIGSVLIIGVFAWTGILQDKIDTTVRQFRVNLGTGSTLQSRYLEGAAYRGAGISYYLQEGLSLLGDGPGLYYDPVTRTRYRGNAGHFLVFLSETGVLGILVSYAVFILIAFERKRKLTWANLMYLMAVVSFGLTRDVMNDISTFLAYCIFTSIGALIPLVSVQPQGQPVPLPLNPEASPAD